MRVIQEIPFEMAGILHLDVASIRYGQDIQALQPQTDNAPAAVPGDWLPENHLARFIGEAVDELDLVESKRDYDETRGYPPYHPRMMLKILIYGYCAGVHSSRKLSKKF